MLRARRAELWRGCRPARPWRQQARRWARSSGTTPQADSVSRLYERFFVQHTHPNGPWRATLSAVRRVLPDGAGRLLDIASGAGEPAVLIATQMPGVSVTCTDIAEEMVEKAKERAAGLPNVECRMADAHDLSAFADGSFDVVTCCYGYMFCEDLSRALSESYRVLRPGGHLIAAVWVELSVFELCRAAVASLANAEPSLPPLHPMNLAKAGLIEWMLEHSNLSVLSSEEGEYSFTLGHPSEEQEFRSESVRAWERVAHLPEECAADAGRRAFLAALDSNSRRRPDGCVEVGPNRFKLVLARKDFRYYGSVAGM